MCGTSLHCFYDQRKGKQSTAMLGGKGKPALGNRRDFSPFEFLTLLSSGMIVNNLSVLPQQTHLSPYGSVGLLPMRLLALDYGADTVL